MPTDNFWDSPKGAILQLERWRSREISLEFEGELETKASNKISNGLLFQECVRKAMALRGRKRAFAVPVVVEMEFTPSLGRPAPAIQSLPKHYLDLLQWPPGGTAADKTRLLLQDDRLVKGLICSYPLGFGHDTPGLRLRVTTRTSFLRQLQLCRKIQNNELNDGIDDEVRREIRKKSMLDEWDDDEFNDPLHQYREHVAGKEQFVKSLSENAFEIHRMFLQQRCQDKILSLSELQPDRLAALWAPYAKRRKHSLFRDLSVFASQERQMYSIIGIDLGPAAVRPGESKAFKKAVRQKLAEVKKKQGLMSPILTTIGVTILYLPPRDGDLIDVDNLARRVIPAVHDELKPPSTIQRAAMAYDKVRTTSDEFSEKRNDELKALNRLPADQVSRYQVFELPRSDSDPTDGHILLILHTGLGSYGPWQVADDIIRAWQEALKDDFRY
jgi:hypothetical protein